MTLLQKVSLVSAACLVVFAAGRYSAPEKVKIEVRTVEVEKKVEQVVSDTDKHKETTVTETVKPDGTKETTTKTVEDTRKKTDDKSKDTTDVRVDSVQETTRGSSKVTISALVGAPLSLSGPLLPVYGGAITKPILGPLTLGIFGLSSGVAGFSAGLTF